MAPPHPSTATQLAPRASKLPTLCLPFHRTPMRPFARSRPTISFSASTTPP
eukprot:CAMPEP_0194265528 /NCGR_PEP_ID=MMETSP0169-20130528/740_1 /TAXON_ID=218684 /ORGANISM="Corethron pennatum, Strain L29A3" /LENGTH=50 /DNA_ID=CAMNT_0039006005 /DNA_START=137 /DNA_END=285 /DNA_ORIENTATION=-